jgi:hypothetical protein
VEPPGDRPSRQYDGSGSAAHRRQRRQNIPLLWWTTGSRACRVTVPWATNRVFNEPAGQRAAGYRALASLFAHVAHEVVTLSSIGSSGTVSSQLKLHPPCTVVRCIGSSECDGIKRARSLGRQLLGLRPSRLTQVDVWERGDERGRAQCAVPLRERIEVQALLPAQGG